MAWRCGVLNCTLDFTASRELMFRSVEELKCANAFWLTVRQNSLALAKLHEEVSMVVLVTIC